MGKLPLPRFASEDEKRHFWAEHDSTEFVDWTKAKRVSFPKLKPSCPLGGSPDAELRAVVLGGDGIVQGRQGGFQVYLLAL